MTGFTEYVQLPCIYIDYAICIGVCSSLVWLVFITVPEMTHGPVRAIFDFISSSVKSSVSAYEGLGSYVWDFNSSSLLFCPDHRQSLSRLTPSYHRQQIDPSFVQQLWLTKLLFLPGESII
ncbi:uncharacterized protein BDW70DRAFT_126739 [Aspergillus foveolatus]|uniref:uncharacterized protein n=1 Tax=Aspergillus foveolatus TaxID=210207 RepID=UPI003CCDD2A5